jgi:hypothetical protein
MSVARRKATVDGALAAMLLTACGAELQPQPHPTFPDAFADPPGGTYTAPVTVRLLPSTVPGEAPQGIASIHFTADGGPPSLDSQVASAPLRIDRNTLLTYFAATHDGRAGPVRTEYYRVEVEHQIQPETGRAVMIEPDLLFLWTPSALDPAEGAVEVRSVGTEPVRILGMRIVEADDPGFGGSDALREFSIVGWPAGPVAPGQTDRIWIRYMPRVETTRAVVLEVETDAERAPVRRVRVFGKVFNWQ